MGLLSKIVDKLFSGKFALLVMVGITYCMSVYLLAYLVIKGKVDGEKFIIFAGGFGTLLGMMWKDYVHADSEDKKLDKQPIEQKP